MDMNCPAWTLWIKKIHSWEMDFFDPKFTSISDKGFIGTFAEVKESKIHGLGNYVTILFNLY